jgi:VanZ family protein
MKRFLNYYLPVLLWMAVIFFFSSRERVSVSETYSINFLFFKTLHVLEYTFLMVLSYRAIKQTTPRFAGILAFVICVAYAVSDEIHQTFIPSREGRLRDVIIDAIGSGFAWIFITQLLPKGPKKLKKLASDLQIFS